MSESYCSFRVNWTGDSRIKSMHNYHPSTHLQSIKVQRASRDTCLLYSQSIPVHPSAGYYLVLNWIMASSWRHRNWYICWLADKCLCKLFEARWGMSGLMDDNCVWNSFNCTTHLFNEPWNCSKHVLVVILTNYILKCTVSPPKFNTLNYPI